jgi:hypothetical protein
MKAATPGLAVVRGALALWCLVLSVPHVSAQAADAKPIDDPESYAVYSALLPDEAIQQMRRSMIVIQAEATVWPPLPPLPPDLAPRPCWPSGPPIDTEWRSVLDSLRTESATARTILPGRALSVPYVVLPKANIDAILGTEGNPNDHWRRFYERYPNSAGYISLSAVGFDPGRTKAMVYMFHGSGSMGASGSYHLLRKLAGRWQDTQVPGVDTCRMMA